MNIVILTELGMLLDGPFATQQEADAQLEVNESMKIGDEIAMFTAVISDEEMKARDPFGSQY